MFQLPDFFTVVRKLKRAFQEAWRVMVFFISMILLQLWMALALMMTRGL